MVATPHVAARKLYYTIAHVNPDTRGVGVRAVRLMAKLLIISIRALVHYKDV